MSNLVIPHCWKLSSKPHRFCPGCGYPLLMKALGANIDEMNIQNQTFLSLDIGCSLLAWDFFNVDTTQTHHGRTIPLAVGYKMSQPNNIALAMIGDGGGYAIGLQHLIHARLRNDNITVILVNNANYGMTGGQRAPTSIRGQKTATGVIVSDWQIDGIKLLTSISPAPVYLARAAVDNQIQMKKYLASALQWQQQKKGFSFVEILSFCPTNWHTNAGATLAYLKELKIKYPLGEF
ncbi:MAG: 2-oxoglutarate synthase [Candidatus Komeilibacteria bacterium CG_4_9_14_3_um_filter_37_5]|nr:MAG: 2-oxoglutarate synthase [Candidatus Komeilibacteria bacterium CG_4_9_14_3_um_filter_37_5]